MSQFDRRLIVVVLAIAVSLLGMAIALRSGTISPTSDRTAATPLPVATRPDLDLEGRWVVGAAEAKQLVETGATLLDANPGWFGGAKVPGAIAIDWTKFSRSDYPHQGELLRDDRALTEKLQALGIDRDRPVVVVGNPENGWGQDGRIVWMLRTLGHEQTALVDGGYEALLEVGIDRDLVPPQRGNFVVKRRDRWVIDRDELKARFASGEVAILDARTPREYAGATPYRETRGGHVPGAISLHYREFIGEDGRIISRSQIVSRLEDAGVTPETAIVTYCTGGVRSGWLTAVLADLGYEVKNYAGSMWEWAAAPANDYPLETE